MRMIRCGCAVALGLLMAAPSVAVGQTPAATVAVTPTPEKAPDPAMKRKDSRLGTEVWCKDATTICWATEEEQRARRWFTGLRFVFEPQLGVLIQQGDDKFDNTNFKSLEKLGLATNLIGRWVGLQTLLIYPSTIQFDEQSPARVNKEVVDATDGKVDVEWGMTFGVTALDGVLSLGGGFLRYDRRDFNNPDTLEKSTFRDSFIYFNIQAVEAIKGAVKVLR